MVVVTVMCPEVTTPGSKVVRVVLVADAAYVLLTFTVRLSWLAVGSKFVPLIVTLVPGLAIDGVKLVIVGKPFELLTVNDALLVAFPVGVVTLILPLVAPVGTVVTSSVGAADVTVAVMLL